jgi:carbonic anhydrase
MGNLTQVLYKIQPAIDEETTVTQDRNGSNVVFVNRVTKLNVLLTMERLRKESPIIAGLEREGAIKIIGGVYNVETGKVTFYK